MRARLAEVMWNWQHAEPLDASILIIAAVALLLVVAHALWTHATRRRESEDWTGEGNVRPWW
jgi:hypothetical protein